VVALGERRHVQRFSAGLSIAVPEGWSARESIELASPEGTGYVRVTSDLLPAGLAADDYAERFAGQLRDRLPGYTELGAEAVQLAGGHGILLSFRWTPPDRDALAELHLYFVREGRGVRARALSPAERFPEVEPKLRKLLLGIGLGTPAAQAGVLRTGSTPRTRTYGGFEAGRLTTTRAEAFGVGSSNGEHDPGAGPAAAAAWKEARESWQKARDGR
jgi:hypothetical protein